MTQYIVSVKEYSQYHGLAHFNMIKAQAGECCPH